MKIVHSADVPTSKLLKLGVKRAKQAMSHKTFELEIWELDCFRAQRS